MATDPTPSPVAVDPVIGREPEREIETARAFLATLLQRRPVVSWVIAALCVGFFGLQLLWGRGNLLLPATAMGAEVPARVWAGEWWRLLAVMLLHGSFNHLLMNLLALLSFGPFLERLIGSARYLVVYVLSGLGGSLLSLQRGGEGIGVGASGGIWGLMIAGAVLVTWPQGHVPAVLAQQWRRRAWGPVAINLAYSFLPGIDFRAHLGGGLAGGLLLAGLLRAARATQMLAPGAGARVAAAVVAVALALAAGLALAHGKPWLLSAPWELSPVALSGTNLALQVPGVFLPGRSTGELRWKWGDLLAQGAEILLQVLPADAGDPDQTLEQVRQELEARPQAGMKRVHLPMRTDLPSGRAAVVTEMVPMDKDDGRRLWMWWVIVEQRPVMVLGNVIQELAELRRADVVRVVDSLQAAGRPR